MTKLQTEHNQTALMDVGQIPDVIDFHDLKMFIRELISMLKRQGMSMRELVRLVGRKAPNYFQRVMDGSHAMPVETCEKLGQLAGMDQWRMEYLVCLAKLQYLADENSQNEIKERMKLMRSRIDARIRFDQIIEETPELSIVLALLWSKKLESKSAVLERLFGKYDPSEILSAFDKLEANGDIAKTTLGYVPRRMVFPPTDHSNANLMKTSEFFLLRWVHQLRSRKEFLYQSGMTVPLGPTQVQKIKALYADFWEEAINTALESNNESQKAYRLQFGLFDVS